MAPRRYQITLTVCTEVSTERRLVLGRLRDKNASVKSACLLSGAGARFQPLLKYVVPSQYSPLRG